MPSVEMRRSTRVFVPKAKDGEFVRVLRSGRRLWVETRGENAGDWCPLIDNRTKLKPAPPSPAPAPAPVQRQNGRHESIPTAADPMEIDSVAEMEPSRTPPRSSLESNHGNRTFTKVYNRKRKRSGGNNSRISDDFQSLNLNDKVDRKFGLHFVRRQRRKVKAFEGLVEQDEKDHGSLFIVVDSSCSGCGVSSRLLSCVLRHLSRETIRVAQIAMLLQFTSISPVFASFGIRFALDRPCIQNAGICRIFGARQFIPLFTVNFAAIPLCFLRLHAAILFRSVRLSCLCSIDFHRENEDSDIDEPLSYINDQSDHSLRRSITADKDDSKGMKAVRTSSAVAKLCSRNIQHRSGVITRSRSKRRRRSLRTRKARNPVPFVLQKANGSAASDRVTVKKNTSSPAVHPDQELRSSARKSSSSQISVQKSNSLAMNVDVGSQCCLANLLVVETDRGYRVEGAEIVLDVSASNEWVLAVKKDGSTRFSLKAQREMRSNHITNRFTHAVIWVAETGWKLEFPDRKDWLVFKELYKVCWERNAIPASPVVKIIPVPGVHEAIDSWDSASAPFKRPDSYIRMTSDELSRALSSRTANYDMDSEDEEWVSKLNNGLGASDLISEETFELIIDAFEKASYCRPEDCDDEKAAAILCGDLANSLVAEEVYRYWVKKRKQKRAPLIRVFQFNQPRRPQLIAKPVLRKKRSLKRSATQPIQCGRGKDSSVLQAIAAEHKAVEEQYSDLTVEDAKVSASRSMEVAIAKRQRAQYLMENADLAVYRATMALRIADAAQVAESEQAAAHFLE